jgi:hypothetical protein
MTNVSYSTAQGGNMEDMRRGDDWRSLCELASKETDPHKLLELITKINRALEESHQRSRTDGASFKVDAVLLPIHKGTQHSFDFYRFPSERVVGLEYDC